VIFAPLRRQPCELACELASEELAASSPRPPLLPCEFDSFCSFGEAVTRTARHKYKPPHDYSKGHYSHATGRSGRHMRRYQLG
jgi:hypothetical protein